MSVRVLTGDCRDILLTLSAASVQCCVTSPPYYGLRDYGHENQIGLQQSPDDYVSAMIQVFGSVRRVLRDDGTLWLNIGDSYCNTDKWGGGGNVGKHTVAGDGSVPSWAVRRKKASMDGIKPKDLLGIPWLLAFALRADGWYLRSDIIWHKPNPMPESVTDRPTSAHEHVFLFAKSERYFYDAGAISEPFSDERMGNPGAYNRTTQKAKGANNDRCDGGFLNEGGGWNADGTSTGRNARNVWTIASQPFSGAHFATMPPDLADRCIKAGSKPGDTVLDPFGGAGTTAVSADRLNRNAIIIELNAAYAAIADNRVRDDAGLFAEVSGA